MAPSFSVRVDPIDGLSAIARDEWDALANPPGERFDPFLSWDFLEALEKARCACPRAGWAPRHLIARDAAGAAVGAMPLYLKGNSYGEYVFDHSWADALHRAGGRYYPKLQSAAPFTPVTGRRVLSPDPDVRRALLAAALDQVDALDASSLHITFLTGEEQAEARGEGFLSRAGVQFHWSNEGYGSFDDFLGALSSQKRKNIRKERERANEACVIRCVSGRDASERDWDHFFACYQDTGARKWGQPYLNRAFFRLVGERMADRVVLFIAEQDGRPIASALNFLGSDTLYGRYWGRLDDVPFLHFELCYYQAIDYAITHGLARVEAGAQGEHKLARGYAPVATYSAHWIAHPGLRRAVADYLERETPAVADEIEHLDQHTPFKRIGD
ncbi:MAG: GNAT family N-acetyltransferase [Caulobacterales bacterium]